MNDQIRQHRIVPVAIIDDAAHAVPLAKALSAGGLPIIEVTLRTPAALEAIRAIRAECPEMLVGAGTVLTPQQVHESVAAGAMFGVSPGLNADVVRTARDAGLFFMPGVMTPSDVEAALALDCRLLKFFPAVPAGGLAMLQSLAGPYAHTGVQFVPLGGVNANNMSDYLPLPSVAAIGGSWICDRALVREQRWSEITALCHAAAQSISLNA
jgi:2-dehydro-3-deoxyphosphogluconate aldolase / (4S)-4-hydroxy-2-oxoglutarate aldolase